jgi:hypothetical protein
VRIEFVAAYALGIVGKVCEKYSISLRSKKDNLSKRFDDLATYTSWLSRIVFEIAYMTFARDASEIGYERGIIIMSILAGFNFIIMCCKVRGYKEAGTHCWKPN